MLANKIVKSVIVGIIFGLLIGLTGQNWNFVNHYHTVEVIDGEVVNVVYRFAAYGTKQAIIGGILASLIAFLKFNKS